MRGRRRVHARRLGAGLGLALVGACGAQVAVESPLPMQSEPRGASSTEASIEAACWAVAVLDPSCDDPLECPGEWACPPELAPDWPLHGKHMFADGTEALSALGVSAADLPSTLRRFCLYRAEIPNAPLEEPNMPASVDCPAALPQGNELTADLQDPLMDVLRLHAGAYDLVPGQAPVEVAIVDTHSDRSSGAPSAAHADSVTHVIDAIACPDPAGCTVERTHALALPLRADGSLADPEDGVYGTRAHLALGVMEAVTAWKQRAEESDLHSPLVLNLSLGWTATTGPYCAQGEDAPWCENHVDELVQRLDTPPWSPSIPTLWAVEALHAALVYASCNGALLVAAAGNARDDSCNAELVAPAVWGKYHAPTLEECMELGFEPPEPIAERLPSSLDEAWPLVTAVAAVRPDDEPIAATRPGSLTPLVAAGWHVTADPTQTPLTGTSMSAAVVSGIAALAWSQAPALRPSELLELMHASGAPLGRASELPLHGWPAGTDVHRVSACAAQPFGATCDANDRGELDDVLAGLAQTSAELAASRTIATYATAEGLASDDCDRCGAPTVALIPPSPPSSTDHWFFEACVATPTTFVFDANAELPGPQPDVPICPDCPLVVSQADGSAHAYLSIDPVYLSPSIDWRGANLVLVDDLGRETVIDLLALVPLDELRSGGVVEVWIEGTWLDLSRATINAVLVIDGKPYTRGNELLIGFQ